MKHAPIVQCDERVMGHFERTQNEYAMIAIISLGRIIVENAVGVNIFERDDTSIESQR